MAGRGGELLFTRVDEQHQRYYKEGDVLPLGGLSLRVMETPGHLRAPCVCCWTEST